eukprot:scaffold740_cov405-Prasinococcus_capsulatus_cf.AAC.11
MRCSLACRRCGKAYPFLSVRPNPGTNATPASERDLGHHQLLPGGNGGLHLSLLSSLHLPDYCLLEGSHLLEVACIHKPQRQIRRKTPGARHREWGSTSRDTSETRRLLRGYGLKGFHVAIGSGKATQLLRANKSSGSQPSASGQIDASSCSNAPMIRNECILVGTGVRAFDVRSNGEKFRRLHTRSRCDKCWRTALAPGRV